MWDSTPLPLPLDAYIDQWQGGEAVRWIADYERDQPFFLFVGLAVLASLIRHAILGDLDPNDFRKLAAVGTVLFFLGKQYGYYMEVPELRPYLLSNTAAVFALTALVLLLPLGLEAMLVGMTATMICYVLLNLRYRHLVRARQVAA